MPVNWTPMRWPAEWKDPSAVSFLRGTPVDALIMDPGALARQVERAGFKVLRPTEAPPGVSIVEGVWPGIRLTSRFGAKDVVSTGPTGEPWVDSNLAPIRLAQARQPAGTAIWVRATPRENSLRAEPLVAAAGDAAVAGGQWVIALPPALASGLLARIPQALQTWKTVSDTAAFFVTKRDWNRYQPEAVPGVLSDFAGARPLDVMHLIARAGQQFRVVLKQKFTPASLAGLKSVIDPDPASPSGSLRRDVLNFVAEGGMLIAGPEWGEIRNARPSATTHPRFRLATLGKGSVAISRTPLGDPYLFASDTGILISHRHDLLRFWNGGPLSATYATAPGRIKALVQTVFYSGRDPGGDTAVRVAGPWKTATLSTVEQPAARPVKTVPRQDGLEIHLPGTAGYIALELEA